MDSSLRLAVQRVVFQIDDALALPCDAVHVPCAVHQIADLAQTVQRTGGSVAQRIQCVCDAVLELYDPTQRASVGFVEPLRFGSNAPQRVAFDLYLAQQLLVLQAHIRLT